MYKIILWKLIVTVWIVIMKTYHRVFISIILTTCFFLKSILSFSLIFFFYCKCASSPTIVESKILDSKIESERLQFLLLYTYCIALSIYVFFVEMWNSRENHRKKMACCCMVFLKIFKLIAFCYWVRLRTLICWINWFLTEPPEFCNPKYSFGFTQKPKLILYSVLTEEWSLISYHKIHMYSVNTNKKI